LSASFLSFSLSLVQLSPDLLHLGDESGFDQHALAIKLANLNLDETTGDQPEEPKRPTRPSKEKERDKSSGKFKKAAPQVNNPDYLLSPSASPTLATNTPLPLSPTTAPPIDLPRPRANSMAPTSEDKLFRGDYSAGEKPHIWFRRLEGKFDDETKLATKLYRFAKNLEPGRPAEIWYRELLDAHKADWDTLYEAFTLRWPLPTIVEPSREELLEKLDQTKLGIEDVGAMIERDGDKVYTHVAWAEEVRALVDILDDTKGHLIPQVRRGLPLAIRLTLPTNLDTWSTFLKAVTSLSMDRLADQRENTEVIRDNILQTMGTGGQQQYNRNTTTARYTATNYYATARQTPYYATKAATTQATVAPTIPPTPSTVKPTYTPTQPWTPRTPATPTNRRFGQQQNTPSSSFLSTNSTLHPSSIFFNQKASIPQTPSRSSPTSQDLARQAIAASSTFPDTPEGWASYQTALQAWEAVYPPAREADFTTAPYPLTPGTATLGSRECYTCGALGHISKDHDPAIPSINSREQRWRAMVGRHLQTRPRMEYSPVAQINTQDEETVPYDPAIYNAAQLDFSEDYEAQGNGEEARD
jgi:hypothetical protein